MAKKKINVWLPRGICRKKESGGLFGREFAKGRAYQMRAVSMLLLGKNEILYLPFSGTSEGNQYRGIGKSMRIMWLLVYDEGTEAFSVF